MQAKLRRWPWVLATFLAITSLALPVFTEEKQEPSEEKVAVVNGTVITQADLDAEMSRIQQKLKINQSPNVSRASQVKKEALENLITHELLYQQSQKEGSQEFECD